MLRGRRSRSGTVPRARGLLAPGWSCRAGRARTGLRTAVHDSPDVLLLGRRPPPGAARLDQHLPARRRHAREAARRRRRSWNGRASGCTRHPAGRARGRRPPGAAARRIEGGVGVGQGGARLDRGRRHRGTPGLRPGGARRPAVRPDGGRPRSSCRPRSSARPPTRDRVGHHHRRGAPPPRRTWKQGRGPPGAPPDSFTRSTRRSRTRSGAGASRTRWPTSSRSPLQGRAGARGRRRGEPPHRRRGRGGCLPAPPAPLAALYPLVRDLPRRRFPSARAPSSCSRGAGAPSPRTLAGTYAVLRRLSTPTAQFAEVLRRSAKDQREHRFVVDAVAAALAPGARRSRSPASRRSRRPPAT